MQKYLDAEDFKKKVKEQIEHPYDVERLIDKEPGVHIVTALDEVAGGTTVLMTTNVIAFQKQYIINHFDDAVKYLEQIKKEGAADDEHE